MAIITDDYYVLGSRRGFSINFEPNPVALTLWPRQALICKNGPLLPYGYSSKASCVRPG